MTKKKTPAELADAKRSRAARVAEQREEREAFAKGKVKGNGVKTGAKKAKTEKPAKPSATKVKAKATGVAESKAHTGRAMAGKAQPALNEAIAKAREGLLNPNGKGDTSVSHGFSGEPLKHIAGPKPKASKAKAAITDLLDTDLAARSDAVKRDADASAWRQPRTTTGNIESTAHRRHLTERVDAETDAEEAVSISRTELAKAHAESTKPAKPRCAPEYRNKVHAEVGRSREDLDVRLTRDEQLEVAESSAHYVAARARLRDLKKGVDTTLGNLVKGYDDLVTTYSRAVETGVLSVPVTTIDILEGGEVRTIRADDGRIITKRKATQDELQPPLFGGDGDGATDENDGADTEAAE